MKLGIDLDGCLANFCHTYNGLLQEVSGRQLPVDFSVWDWDKQAGYTSEERSKAWKHINTSDEFWFNLAPLDYAVDAIELLANHADDNEIYFITHRAGKQAKQQSEDWLFGHGFNHPTVLISGDIKTPLIEGLNLDFYVDDRWETMFNVAQLKNKKDINLYLMDAPYNKVEIPGVRRVSSVLEGLEDFIGGRL